MRPDPAMAATRNEAERDEVLDTAGALFDVLLGAVDRCGFDARGRAAAFEELTRLCEMEADQ